MPQGSQGAQSFEMGVGIVGILAICIWILWTALVSHRKPNKFQSGPTRAGDPLCRYGIKGYTCTSYPYVTCYPVCRSEPKKS